MHGQVLREVKISPHIKTLRLYMYQDELSGGGGGGGANSTQDFKQI